MIVTIITVVFVALLLLCILVLSLSHQQIIPSHSLYHDESYVREQHSVTLDAQGPILVRKKSVRLLPNAAIAEWLEQVNATDETGMPLEVNVWEPYETEQEWREHTEITRQAHAVAEGWTLGAPPELHFRRVRYPQMPQQHPKQLHQDKQ